MTARRERLAAAFALLVAMPACKTTEATEAPAELADDIAQIEATLRQRDNELGNAGIVVAYRSPTPADDAKSEPPTVNAPDEPGRDFTTDEEDAGPRSEPTSGVTTESPSQPSAVEERLEREVVRERQRVRTSRRSKRSVRQDDSAPRSRCEKICVLAETTCELRDKVCELAGRHPDDVRYEAACTRAEDQCSAASSHCESCAV